MLRKLSEFGKRTIDVMAVWQQLKQEGYSIPRSTVLLHAW